MIGSKFGLMALSLIVLAACSSTKTVDVPAKLVSINSVLEVNRLWSESLGGGGEYFRLGLQPAVDAGVVYAAGYKGSVVALNAESGSRIWQAKTGLVLSSGPTVGEGLVVVGGTDGLLLALSTDDGQERWRYQLSSEPLSKALVTQQVVIVRTVDGRLIGLNADNGTMCWSYEGTVPKLSLRGTARPVLAEAVSAVIEGFDDGKLVALDIKTGDLLWSATVDSSSGRTELDRLADVDAAAAVLDRDVFVAGYNGKVAMLDVSNGQVWWEKEASSYRGFGVDVQTLYLSTSKGEVTALRRNDGHQQLSLIHI
jgi:outer membrane protein assembly factor BamB